MRIGKSSYIFFQGNMDIPDGIPQIANESIHLCFYSPPYFNFIEYANQDGIGKKSDTYQDYLNDLEKLNTEIFKKIIPGGRLVINITNLKARKAIEGKSFIYPLVADTIAMATQIGFTFFEEIIWDKDIWRGGKGHKKMMFGSYPYPPTPKMLDGIYENILVFTKEGKRPKVAQEIKEKSKLTIEQWREWTRGIWKIRTDSNKRHPATFPIKLAERVIRLYSFYGDRVLDPFAGTGTTLIAAENYGRQGIGYEIATKYKEAIKQRIQEHLNPPEQLTLKV